MKTRINVVGNSASGKSTFARALAVRLDVDYIEMDALFWKPNWGESTDAEFLQSIEQRTLGKSGWVLDGNYTRTIPTKWQEVEQVIWIDTSFGRNLYQSIYRALNRCMSKKELWLGTGNVETWGKLFTKDSIVWWMIKNHRRNRGRYLRMMADPAYSHIEFVRLRSSSEIDDYLDQI